MELYHRVEAGGNFDFVSKSGNPENELLTESSVGKFNENTKEKQCMEKRKRSAAGRRIARINI